MSPHSPKAGVPSVGADQTVFVSGSRVSQGSMTRVNWVRGMSLAPAVEGVAPMHRQG